MLNCERSQILIADALYEELEPARARVLNDHLNSCRECTRLYQELRESRLQIQGAGLLPQTPACDFSIHKPQKPDPLWDRLEPDLNRIDAERFHRMSKRNKFSILAVSSALAASVILVVSGMLFLPENPEPSEAIAAELVSPILMNYLNKAQVMLLLVANAASDDVTFIPISQSQARDMAIEASMLGASMDNNFNSGQMRLLKDIEYLLLQIANLDESNMQDGVALMQQFLEKSSVLFKIRLLEMREPKIVT